MKRRRILLNNPEKVYSTQLKTVEDDYLLELIEIYPLKDIKKYIKIPSSLYPMLLELDRQFHPAKDGQKAVISLSSQKAINKLNEGYTPSELSKYHVIESKSLEILHYKLNEVKPKMEEQVYCSNNTIQQFKWLLKRNKVSQLDILANEIRGIFQNNTNLRLYAY